MTAPTPTGPIRILHLEDDPNDAELLSMILAEENIPSEIYRVDTRGAFTTALEKQSWDLVISDYSLPSFDGLKALSLIREKLGDMPFILFSGTIGEETAIECLKHGATDYVLKQRPARLVAAVRNIFSAAEERERRKKFELELQRSAAREKEMEARFLRMQRMESIGALVSGIAHDLNNALAPVLMGCGFLHSIPLNGEAQQIVSTMEASARRGADMLRHVLAFARGVESKKSPVQLRLLLGEMEKIARDAFPKNIRVRAEFAANLWPVLGYATQLHQVLMNLCINARDAMPDGGQLTLRAENVQLDTSAVQMHPEAKPGAYLLLGVADTGVGMPLEVIEKIFQPFFTTKELRGGTGLGLSTSLDIVKNHGGFVSVKSRVGEGTEFNVYLPAVTAPADSETEPQLSRVPSGNGEMILLVDDEVAICEITKAALENYGYRVLVANSGPEAVTLYTQKRKDIKLVITDTAMPFMDGEATSAALKEINPALKIIMASDGPPAKNIKESLPDANIAAFAPKPYTVEKLLTTVHDVLQQKSQAD
jgi:two-component system cell cycle sensor histidine kinase/response regulator CckA